MTENKQIEIYQSDDGQMQIRVRLEKDTVWLYQAQMAELFDKNADTIGSPAVQSRGRKLLQRLMGEIVTCQNLIW